MKRHPRLVNPGGPAFRAFGGLGQFRSLKLETAFAAAGRRHLDGEFGVLETPKQVQQVGLHITRRLANEPCDLRDGHRIALKQRDEIFAKHAQAKTIWRKNAMVKPSGAAVSHRPEPAAKLVLSNFLRDTCIGPLL
jgi:hypothetical protein